MGAAPVTDLPPGFVLDAPPPPAGLPPGFVLDGAPAPVQYNSTSTITASAPDRVVPPYVRGGAVPPARVAMDTVVDAAGTVAGNAAGLVEQGARGARRGLANVLGLPVDAATWLINQAYGAGAAGYDAVRSPTLDELATGRRQTPRTLIDSRTAVGGSDWIDQTLLSAGGLVPEPPAPAGPFQRGARRVGEEAGAAAGVVAGTAAAALRAAPRVVAGARGILTDLFVRPYQVNPAQYVRGQFTTGGAAGAGAAAVNEATRAAGYDREQGSTVGQVGDLLGSLAGGGAYAVGDRLLTATREAGRALTAGPAAYESEATRQAAADVLASMFRRPVGGDYGPLATRIEGGRRPGEVVPGYRETLADRTQDPAVAAETYGRASGRRAPEFAVRNTENVEAVDRALQAAQPQGNAGALIDAVIAERNARIAGATAEADRLAAEADRLAAALAPQSTQQGRGQTIRGALMTALDNFTGPQAQNVEATRAELNRVLTALQPSPEGASREARGQVIRGALSDAEEAAQQGVREAYGRVGAEGVTADAAATKEALDAVTNSLPLAERGMAPRDLIDAVAARGAPGEGGAAPAPLPLDELTSLRTVLLDRARALRADPRAESGGANAARVVDRYVAAVEDMIQRSLPPDQAALLAEARAAAAGRAESFGRRGDPVADVLANREGGRPRVPDQQVPGRFVNPEADAPLARLFAEADTPAVRQAISDEILSRLGRAPTVENVESILQQYGRTLDQFPELRQRLQGATDAGRAATAAEEALAARRGEFTGGSRVVADATTVRPDGVPVLPDEALAGAVVSPSGTRDLDAVLRQADTPATRQAIRDQVIARSGVGQHSPETVEDFLRQNTETLQRFPGLEDELRTALGAQRAATDASAAARQTEATLTNRNQSTIANVTSFSPDQVHRAIGAIIQSSNPGRAADDLMQAVGKNPEAIAGARRALWDWIESRSRSGGEMTATTSGVQPWLPEKLNQIVTSKATREVAERFYADNPEHWQNIQKIAAAIRHTSLQARGRAANASGTGQTGSNVLTPETAMSRLYAAETGRASYVFAVSSIAAAAYRRLMRNARSKSVSRLVDEALLNPDFAAALLRENNPANRQALRRAIPAAQLNRWSEALDILEGEDN